MKHYKTIQVQKEVPDRIICNCCGQEISITGQHPYPEYLSIHKEWGYDSPYDGETHEIDICPACYEKWITTFCVSPRAEAQEDPETAAYESSGIAAK